MCTFTSTHAGGYENLAYYPECELEFMGVANIHVVRDAYNKLKDLCDTLTSDSECNYLFLYCFYPPL